MISKKQIDEHTERKEYVTTCNDCGWTSEVIHTTRGECTTTACPECKSDYIIDCEYSQWDEFFAKNKILH